MANETVTIKDVARTAGVAVGTVSRVLNSNVTVKGKTRLAVMQAMEKLGYEPNALAQSMRRRLSHTVGCVLREINVPSLAEFVRSAESKFDSAGYSLFISNSGGDSVKERELLRRMKRQQTDGILIGPYNEVNEEFELFLRRLAIPLVLINRDTPLWVDAVMTDFRKVTKTAVEHLLTLGHTRVALITGDSRLYPARERIAGYEEAYRRSGVPLQRRLIRNDGFTSRAGAAAFASLLQEPEPPTAVIAGGMELLAGILRVIAQRNLKIPQDISVIGAGDSELAELASPSISVMRWDEAELGRVAAGLLLDRLTGEGAAAPRHVVLPSQFVLRESTAPPKDSRRSRSAKS